MRNLMMTLILGWRFELESSLIRLHAIWWRYDHSRPILLLYGAIEILLLLLLLLLLLFAHQHKAAGVKTKQNVKQRL